MTSVSEGQWPTGQGVLSLGRDDGGYGGLVLHLSGPAGRVEWWRHGGVRVHGKAVAPGWYFALDCPVYGSGCWTGCPDLEGWSMVCDQTYRDNLRLGEGSARQEEIEVYATLADLYRHLWISTVEST